MEKTYNPQAIEKHWYDFWENNNYFQAKLSEPSSASTDKNYYCVMLPPPNVTGSLHMGHGFQQTLMDALVRYHRMSGAKTLWQVGTDHAGIATQMVVENQLKLQNKTRHDLGREEFIEHVWQWKKESGGNITKQMRRLGVSSDWSRERFTMDTGFCQAVNEVFIRLYDEKFIYRGKRLINWDPQLLTAVSDLEAIAEESSGHLWYIRYPLVNGHSHVMIATTRPETLLGDVAVAVHPEDERYQSLIGQYLHLPLTDRTIPIIADETVEREFGTGCVKITPAHDFNDYAMGQKHNLPLINIFTPNAHLNENTPEKYRGLERFAARKKIINDLQEIDLVEKIEPHTLKIPRGEKSGAILEPMLTDQWFIKMQPLAAPAINAVKQGELKFVPDNWSKTYLQWLENIEDWCISRQLWWGHRIPAWYDDNHQVYVGIDEQHVREKYNLSDNLNLRPEEDVLDTWFSAALWPFATLGWPENTAELANFYPTNVLVTGFDIIFFWIARMVMLGLKFTGKLPFHEVYITGLIRDHEGKKMSKSKGNVLDPIDLIDGIDLNSLVKKRTSGLMQLSTATKIEQATRKQFPEGIPAFGTDALRFTFCALASTSRDINFDLNRVEGYRNFCNKLWNAARFVIMNVSEKVSPELFTHREKYPLEFSLPDQWIRSRLQKTVSEVHGYFQTYRFDLLANTVYEFVWNEFCDWYLELCKPVLNSSTASQAQLNGTRFTLLSVLEIILRLLHPLMPFLTEEIWQKTAALMGNKNPTIMLESYPKVDTTLVNKKADETIEWMKAIILGLRNLRGEMRISPAKSIPVLCKYGESTDRAQLKEHETLIKTLAKITSIDWLTDDAELPACAMVLTGTLQLYVPLAGLIDIQAEIQRIEKEINRHQKDLLQAQTKLANSHFVQNAPAEVVAKEKARIEIMGNAIAKLQGQKQSLEKTSV